MFDAYPALAQKVLNRCAQIARCTEEPGRITRRFLSPAVGESHALLRGWMNELGMRTRTDAIGNLIGRFEGDGPNAKTFLVGSHIDSVVNAGAFDGPLGVVMGLALVEILQGKPLPFALEVVAFSEEEGVRFSTPFLGSKALIGRFPDEYLALKDGVGKTLSGALLDFGLNPSEISHAAHNASQVLGFMEFHIEQGPVLDLADESIAIVEGIAGQTRLELTFLGIANHAGTTPMHARQDALACAAQWITEVEKYATGMDGLVATVGSLRVMPGSTNVIAGEVRASLDVRHNVDQTRREAVQQLIEMAKDVAQARGIEVELKVHLEQDSILCNSVLLQTLAAAASDAGQTVRRMFSGAGHDAMIMADFCPSGMIFLRSPKGISHNPAESVLEGDVELALRVGHHFLQRLSISQSEPK